MELMDVDYYVADIIEKVKSYNPKANLKIIERATRFAYELHKERFRLSGEGAFIHCYNIAVILASLKLDSHTIAAGLLHDAMQFGTRPEEIRKEFDDETAQLASSISKLKHAKNNVSMQEYEETRAENIRKILLATAKDVRVILVKLADRLDNLSTIEFIPKERINIIAKETMDVYAPIAAKLGLYNLKSELEDLAFRILDNKTFLEISEKIKTTKEQRTKELEKIMDNVRLELKKNDIEAEVYGRAKSVYSIYKKIIKSNKRFDEIYDLIAIRIITNSVNECYAALGIVHKLFTPVPGRFKDYIAVPKPNSYSSLHTDVLVGEGKILEIQIRDRAMHMAAEEGTAAHWRYKGTERDKKFDRKIEWLKQVLDWKRNSRDSKEFIESLKLDLFQKQIFVFTPKGDPIELAEKSTPVDFAYAVHSDIGDHCKAARVNGAIVPLDHELLAGDIIEIITAKNATPSRTWLSFAKSLHAKMKIRQALNIHVDKRMMDKKSKHKEDTHEELLDSAIVSRGKSYAAKIARCCSPKTNDLTRAFKTKDGKIVVHKAGCPNIASYDSDKEIFLDEKKAEKKITTLRIDAKDNIGVLAQILSFIAKKGFNVGSINTRLGRDGRVIITLEVEKTDTVDIERFIPELKKFSSVINIYEE